MRVLGFMAALVLGIAAAPAVAQDFDDDSALTSSDLGVLQVYARVNVGVALPGTIQVTGAAGSNGSPAFTGTMTFDAGPTFQAALGARFSENLRGEIAAVLASNRATSYNFDFTGFGNSSGAATGTVTTFALMGVGYYDFTQFGDFVPYLSAGLGAVNVSTNDLVAVSPTGVTSGSSTVPAFRLGGGFNYKVTESVSLGVDYFALVGGQASLTYNDPANANTRSISAGTLGHSLTASLKFSF